MTLLNILYITAAIELGIFIGWHSAFDRIYVYPERKLSRQRKKIQRELHAEKYWGTD